MLNTLKKHGPHLMGHARQGENVRFAQLCRDPRSRATGVFDAAGPGGYHGLDTVSIAHGPIEPLKVPFNLLQSPLIHLQRAPQGLG